MASDVAAAVHLRDSLSGAFGAACLVACGAPFDTVKLRVQMRLFGGTLDAFRGMLRNEGILSFWKGSGPAFASAVIENTVLFTTQGIFRRAMAVGRHESAEPSPLEHVLVGAASGVFSATAICPAEVVKVQMQYQRNGNSAGAPRYPTGWHCAASILRESGPRGLFAGLGPLLARDIPFSGCFFGSYRTIVAQYRSLTGRQPRDDLPGGVALCAGGMAGVIAWCVVFPCDVLKSRAQVAARAVGQGHVPMREALRSILAEGGIRGLYFGLSAAVLRSFPANAALFWGVETAERYLKSIGM